MATVPIMHVTLQSDVAVEALERIQELVLTCGEDEAAELLPQIFTVAQKALNQVRVEIGWPDESASESAS